MPQKADRAQALKKFNCFGGVSWGWAALVGGGARLVYQDNAVSLPSKILTADQLDSADGGGVEGSVKFAAKDFPGFSPLVILPPSWRMFFCRKIAFGVTNE